MMMMKSALICKWKWSRMVTERNGGIIVAVVRVSWCRRITICWDVETEQKVCAAGVAGPNISYLWRKRSSRRRRRVGVGVGVHYVPGDNLS
jgi:hypothetical protein